MDIVPLLAENVLQQASSVAGSVDGKIGRLCRHRSSSIALSAVKSSLSPAKERRQKQDEFERIFIDSL
jgi:hypothetical protein